MNLNEQLGAAFDQFIRNEVSSDLLRGIRDSATVDDTITLIGSVDSLGDPSEYCVSDLDEKTPSGFFLYIDFISALIIHLGDTAKQKTQEFSNTEHPFVKWVVKYVEDERLHEEVTSKFNEIFSQ